MVGFLTRLQGFWILGASTLPAWMAHRNCDTCNQHGIEFQHPETPVCVPPKLDASTQINEIAWNTFIIFKYIQPARDLN